MISARPQIANKQQPVTLPAAAPFGHTPCFSKATVVHSGPGDVIKCESLTGFAGGKKKLR
jgi:hypothetical protein